MCANSRAKERSSAFAVMQKLGKSIMLPISVLPVAGLLLGIGASFSNESTIAMLGAESIMGDGTVLNAVFLIMAGIGTCIFDNLPLIFAVGIAIGFANSDRGTAALASVVSFLTMHMTINRMLTILGAFDSGSAASRFMLDGMTANVLGITSLQMGVLGGILVGLITAFLHNRFHDVKLPDYLAFFGGNRFVPIVCVFAFFPIGVISTFIWPYVQVGINQLGYGIADLGLLGTFLYDFIKRLLIPTGLHHVFYLPFWQTSIGGTAVVAGQQVIGAQNILFAQIADPGTAHISVEATQYFAGEYPIMLFGLPAAAFAIYLNARKENKASTKSLMESAALTSFITGITEPIEFPILFAAPALYVFHAVMSGLSNVCLYLLNFAVGCTFSDGLIDLILLGVLPGNAKTGWLAIFPVGIAIGIIYFLVFYFAIKKFNLKTPGREDETSFEIAVSDSADPAMCQWIASGLGGISNISSMDCCATRLRCTVKDTALINKEILTATGAMGVVVKEKAVQVIYGPKVNLIKKNMQAYQEGKVEVHAPASGRVIPLKEVPDEAFSAGTLGPGVAIEPDSPIISAPEDGTVIFVADTKHAIGFMCDNGVSLLIHIGIDTVELGGKGFEQMAEAGAFVKRGDPLMKLDLDYLKKNAPSLITPIVLPELENPDALTFTAEPSSISAPSDVLMLFDAQKL